MLAMVSVSGAIAFLFLPCEMVCNFRLSKDQISVWIADFAVRLSLRRKDFRRVLIIGIIFSSQSPVCVLSLTLP